MKKWISTLWFFLIIPQAFAGNIAIIDSGADGVHIDSISNRSLIKKCYSATDQGSSRTPNIGEDENVSLYYIYKRASGCPFAGAEETGYISYRLLRDYRLKNGQYEEVLLGGEHLSHMAHTALQYTSQKLILLNIPTHVSVSGDYESARSLDETFLNDSIIKALDFILANRVNMDIRVVNMSFIRDLHNTKNAYCDGASLGTKRIIEDKIKLLIQYGVAVVAAAGNRLGVGHDESTGFPACLREVIAVGGYSRFGSKGYLYGAISLNQDFVETISYTGYDGSSVPGTSGAAAKVSGYISELMAINPSLSAATIHQKLLVHADLTGRLYFPNTNDKKYHTNRLTPNFERVKSVITSDSTYGEYLDFSDQASIDGAYGSQFGTNSHPNGLKVLFQTSTTQSKTSSLQTTALNSNIQKTYYRLRLKAYDIDSADEVQIFLNGQFHGYLSTTANNTIGEFVDYYFDLADLYTSKSNIVTLRQKQSGERWGVQNITLTRVTLGECDLVSVNDQTAATPIAGTASASQDEVTYSDSATHNFCNGTPRYYYGFNVGFDTYTYTTTPPARDLLLTLNASSLNGSSNGLDVKVNGILAISVEPFSGNKSVSIVVNRNYFSNGSNTIIIEPSNTDPANTQNLEIRNITATFLSSVALGFEQTYTQDYGYTQSPTRYTGARFNFYMSPTRNDTLFSIKGWDIDRSDETKVYLNGQYYGSLSQSPTNNDFNAGDQFIFRIADLNIGKNNIELIQRSPDSLWSGYEDEKWYATNLSLQKLLPDLSVIEFRRLSGESIGTNIQVSLKSIIRNIGAGASNANLISYYISADKIITSSDQVLSSTTFNSIASGSSRTFNKVLNVPNTTKHYFIGVCVSKIESEASYSNNCSKGVKASGAVIAPFIMLLLDE